jgi:hypothetical protein
LTCNLSEVQWQIVADLQKVLKPFMIPQKLLEGQSYATISPIPYLLFKVRKNLVELRESLNSPSCALSISGRMIHELEEIFGSGLEGIVEAENLLPEGPRRWPRGIPILLLMASLLDPRTKGGVGIPQANKEFTYANITEALICIAKQLELQVALNNNNNNNADDDDEMIRQPKAAHHQENDMDAMLEELNGFYMGDNEGRNDMETNNTNIQQQQRVNVFKAELLLYKSLQLGCTTRGEVGMVEYSIAH